MTQGIASMPAHYTFAGFWLSLLMAGLMYFNALRTVIDPVAFSRYMGLPVGDGHAVPWVRVYGLRALFIALLVTCLLVRGDPATLQWVAAMAVPLALGDAWLVKSTGGTTARRHLAIAAVLVLCTGAIHAWAAASVSP